MVNPSRPPVNRPQARANLKKRPVAPPVRAPQPEKLPVDQHPTPQKSRSPSSLWMVLAAITFLLAGMAGIAGSAWLAMQLMVNPQQLLWINRYIPDWIPIPVTGLKPPQTLNEIRQEIQQIGAIPAEPLPLGKNKSILDHKTAAADLLVPILRQRDNCQSDCERIVELRVYQTTQQQRHPNDRQTYYQLVTQLAIAGLEESFVIAPLIDAQADNQGSTRSLPLTTLSRFEGLVPAQGVWLTLSGKRSRADETILYGRMIHYNPQRLRLNWMLDWTSPAAQPPIWQEVTGDGTPELVVNQTIGMEPQFKLYQIKPVNFLPNPIQLEPISLFEPALEHPTYHSALMLARSGLWSPSLHKLQALKQAGTVGPWSAAAQAQMDFIRLHAQVTKVQAETAWASPSQQVLADLVDGRWKPALQVFGENFENSREIAGLLQADAGPIRRRVEAALKVASTQWDLKAWLTLLIAAQQGEARAIAWLKKQPKTSSADFKRIETLVNQIQAGTP